MRGLLKNTPRGVLHGFGKHRRGESILVLLAGCQITLRPQFRDLTPTVHQKGARSQCFKSESDLTQASGGLAEQAEGKEVAQVPGWTHARGSLEHEDRVLVASHGVGRKALSGERPRGAAAVAQGGRERRCGDACRALGALRKASDWGGELEQWGCRGEEESELRRGPGSKSLVAAAFNNTDLLKSACLMEGASGIFKNSLENLTCTMG